LRRYNSLFLCLFLDIKLACLLTVVAYERKMLMEAIGANPDVLVTCPKCKSQNYDDRPKDGHGSCNSVRCATCQFNFCFLCFEDMKAILANDNSFHKPEVCFISDIVEIISLIVSVCIIQTTMKSECKV
jgi:hypothetical protein